MMRLSGGVYAASLTPMHADLSVAHSALVRHCRWLLNNGCDGIVLLGTTGEANSLCTAERMALLDAVLAAGLPASRIMVGTGCCSVPETITLTRHALAGGVCNALMLPPFYYKRIPDEGVFAAFDQVIQAIGSEALQVYLYHFPQMTSVPFTDALIARLMDAFPRTIVGMKDSSGDFGHMARVIAAFPELRIFAGTERYLVDVLRLGGAGCITATTNITCSLAAAVYADWRRDGVGPQERLTKARAAIEAYPMIPALKHIMAARTGETAWRAMRPPQAPLETASATGLLAEIESLLALEST